MTARFTTMAFRIEFDKKAQLMKIAGEWRMLLSDLLRTIVSDYLERLDTAQTAQSGPQPSKEPSKKDETAEAINELFLVDNP